MKQTGRSRGTSDLPPPPLSEPQPKTTMKTNIGGLDRLVRIIAGLAILGAGYYYKSWWGLIGFVPLLTAAVRFCPAYLPIGLNTCSRPNN